MNIEELLAKFDGFDEMEQQDGMNLLEDVEEENELADKKSKKRVYLAAVEAIEKLRDELEEGIDPATGKLDVETEDFFNKLGEIVDEILSRSYAFDESLNETVIEKDNMVEGNVVKTELGNFGIAIHADGEEDVRLGTVVYGTQTKKLSGTDYKLAGGEDIVADVTEIVNRNMKAMEKEVKDLLNLI